VLGELIALGSFPDINQIVLGFLSVFFISATALILNDYVDIEADKINAPHRALPSGLVTRKHALYLFVIVSLAGFICAAMISLQAFFAVVIVWLNGVLYNCYFKQRGLIGNIMVATSVGMTFIFGGIVVGKPFENLVLIFSVMVFLFDLAEEIAADAMDAKGDKIAGSKSLAIIYGSDIAFRISAAIFILLIIVNFIPFILGMLQPIFLIPVLYLDFMIIYTIRQLLNRNNDRKRKAIKNLYLNALIAFLIMILFKVIQQYGSCFI
ncbi:MAG: UbiA family prenyltransferase, partial [Fibrobacteres bacterium]|nr:UbiA family prenyltransferase [Fibrobacterota bacterium]